MSDRFDEPREPSPTLAGATILQIVPELREEPNARSALNVAHMLLQSGARALEKQTERWRRLSTFVDKLLLDES